LRILLVTTACGCGKSARHEIVISSIRFGDPVGGLSALGQAAKPDAAKDEAKAAAASEVAVMQTTEGTMVIEFWPDVAPKDGRELQEAGPAGVLRWHGVSSDHQGLHDPGR
jgi:hypothetical protein